MAYGIPTTYRGSDARVQISGSKVPNFGFSNMSIFGFGDYSMTLARGTVEQPLVGEIGNFKAAGTLSCEGSITMSKLDTDAAVMLAACMITGGALEISGSCGAQSLQWYFVSCMITGFDVKLGDANTVTTATVGYKVMDPQNVRIQSTRDPSTLGMGTYIGDA